MLEHWLTSTAPGDLATADPRTATPMPPDFGVCGTWGGGAAAPCEPWRVAHMTCSGASEHFPGEDGCRSVGAACPAPGSWASGLPTSGSTILRVSATAAAGGDGSASAPFRTIAEAITAAGTLTGPIVIALTAGSYTASAVLPASTTLWGACTETTTIAPIAAVDTVIRAGSSSVIRDLRVTGGAIGIEVPAGSTATLRGVIVEHAATAIAVPGGTVDANDLAIRSSRGGLAEDDRGVHVSLGGTFQIDLGVVRAITGNVSFGLYAVGGSSRLLVTNVAILDYENTGVRVMDGASIAADGLALERGLEGISGVSAVDVQRVVIRDMGSLGVGIIDQFALVSVQRALIERVGGTGLLLNGPSTVRDVILRDLTGSGGAGVAAWVGTLLLERARIERTDQEGITIWDGETATVRWVEMIDPGRNARETVTGVGVVVTDRANLTLSASHITGAHGSGVLAGSCYVGGCSDAGDVARWGTGSSATLTDVAITGTLPSRDGVLLGHGMLVMLGARIDARRTLVTDTAGAHILGGYASLGLVPLTSPPRSSAILTDVMLRGGGGGILALDGTTFTGSSVVVATDSGTGIAASGNLSSVTLSDVVVADADDGSLMADAAGTLALQRAWVRRSANTCARARSGGSITLTDAELRECGEAVVVETGASAALTRAEVIDAARTAIRASGTGTTLTLTDLAISDALVATELGLVLRQRAHATLRSVSMDIARDGAIALAESGTVLDAQDVRLACVPTLRTGLPCSLLVATSGASATFTRAIFEHAHGLAVAATGIASSLTLADALIRDTVGASCTASPCAVGAAAYDGGSTTVQRFAIERTDLRGAVLAGEDGVLLLETGVVSGATACVELPAATDQGAVLVDVLTEGCAVAVARDPSPRPTLPSVP